MLQSVPEERERGKGPTPSFEVVRSRRFESGVILGPYLPNLNIAEARTHDNTKRTNKLPSGKLKSSTKEQNTNYTKISNKKQPTKPTKQQNKPEETNRKRKRQTQAYVAMATET